MRKEIEIRKLKMKQAELESEHRALNQQKNFIETQIISKNKELDELNEKLSELSRDLPKEITISPRAIFDYVLKIEEYDISYYNTCILLDSVKKMIQENGDGIYVNKNYKVKVVNNEVVRIITDWSCVDDEECDELDDNWHLKDTSSDEATETL